MKPQTSVRSIDHVVFRNKKAQGDGNDATFFAVGQSANSSTWTVYKVENEGEGDEARLVWKPILEGLDGDVNQMVVEGDNLIIVGSFTRANGQPITPFIATFDIRKEEWNRMPMVSSPTWNMTAGPNERPEIETIAQGQSGHMFIGGRFRSVNGAGCINVCWWDGQQWKTLSKAHNASFGLDGGVVTIIKQMSAASLWVGGNFTTVFGKKESDTSSNNLIEFNLATLRWNSIGQMSNPVPGTVNAIAAQGKSVFVAGQGSNEQIPFVMHWDSAGKWTDIGKNAFRTGTIEDIQIMPDDKDRAIIAGNFTLSNGGMLQSVVVSTIKFFH
jgi:hypothetical protein